MEPDDPQERHMDPRTLNPLESAPKQLQRLFKAYKHKDVNVGVDNQDLREVTGLDKSLVLQVFEDFLLSGTKGSSATTISPVLTGQDIDHGRMCCSDKIKGLYVLPNLLSLDVQNKLLSCLLHRDLSNPQHKTNLHAHYNIPYPPEKGSFFRSSSYESPNPKPEFTPKDPSHHTPLSLEKALESKLRWMTLGGQYDWTLKAYPMEEPPPFPPDIAALIKSLFPDIEPEAAIVNVYHPHDTLGLHRDVSESSNRGLVSISFGLDCLFFIGLEDSVSGETRSHILRVKSGDAVIMSEEARFAWHGVPSIILGTCPSRIASWPGEVCEDPELLENPPAKGWMENKRINFSIRQMYEHP